MGAQHREPAWVSLGTVSQCLLQLRSVGRSAPKEQAVDVRLRVQGWKQRRKRTRREPKRLVSEGEEQSIHQFLGSSSVTDWPHQARTTAIAAPRDVTQVATNSLALLSDQ